MDVLIRPLVTEKMTAKNTELNQFGFIVAKRANKIQIKEAVEKLFNVKVAKVATAHVVGKKKRVGARSVGKTRDWKKAYVTLAEGKIDFLDNL